MARFLEDSDYDTDTETLEMLNEFNIHYRPYVVRERQSNFNKWDDVEFARRFRVTKQTARMVLREIEDDVAYPTTRNNALTAAEQLLLTLRFYATGCMQITAGDFTGVHQTTAGKTIKRVTQAIASKRSQYIKLPLTLEEQRYNQCGFYAIARFPLVSGALDCTHIRIQSPGGSAAENFRNRKGYFSINTQALCTFDLKFSDIVARWPGASHDSMIFQNSRLCAVFESGQMGQQVILGDSGYPLKNYLLTPLQNPQTNPEKLYNESQIRTRNCIERAFGVWKRRFPVLSLGMRVKIELAQDIIVATAILHNLCTDNGDELPAVNADVEDLIDLTEDNPVSTYNNQGNFSSRRLGLINGYFNSLLLQ